jgi:Beta-lactamase enzyme family
MPRHRQVTLCYLVMMWSVLARLAALGLVLAVAGTAAGAEPRTPLPYEVFFGPIVALGPAEADRAALYLGDRRVAERAPVAGRVRFDLRHPPDRYDVRIRWERAGRVLRRDEARSAWLLGPAARAARRERGMDHALATRLGAVGRSFPGWAGLWVHDLRSGRTAGWNSDASFPAASLVKLGVLTLALDRYGSRPERSSAWPLIRDLATWSSNDASNRLLVLLGGSEGGGARLVEERLHRMGARSSTFTGNYVLGTAYDAPRPVPFLSYRRTTAHDVGRVLFELHAGATGNGLALRRTGLTRHEARVAVGLLLSAASGGDNRGLLRPWLRVPMARKEGWTTKLRHSAAIVYRPSGPMIAVVLTYRPGLRHADALALGAAVARLIER